MSLKEIPWVIQYNKRDLPDITDVETFENELNEQKVPSFEAVASSGEGVYETMEGIAQIVFKRIREDLKNVRGSRDKEEEVVDQEIDVEIVAKGISGMNDSEADESESLENAENEGEEHESVSEFVDSVLKEKDRIENGVDLGATRGGYEEYGHVVDLNGDEEKSEPKKVKAEEKREEDIEIISDPLGKLSKGETPKQPKGSHQSTTAVKVKEEKTIRVPVRISTEDLEDGGRIKLVLDITVDRG